MGEEFLAFGFPVEGPHPDGPADEPVPRLLTGHYQRFFEHASSGGYRYLAGEMSIAAPSGLSGGPVFRRNHPEAVTGLVTASLESYSIQDSVTEVHDNGGVHTLESRKVLSYGLALMLSGVDEWLRSVIPEREGLGWDP